MSDSPVFLFPDWPAPAPVRALVTTRAGGVSRGSYAGLNLATHVGDEPAAVAANRKLLRVHLPAEPRWLTQVHGVSCVAAESAPLNVEADASATGVAGVVCAVLTADCLPLLLCDDRGTAVAAVHAGWRGLAEGVIEAAICAMGLPAERLLVWLGPAIGPTAFEVGDDVRAAFLARDAGAAAAFLPREGKWHCDLYALARRRLAAAGVRRVFGGGLCTLSDAGRFYSFRRDGAASGRMASLVWLAAGEVSP